MKTLICNAGSSSVKFSLFDAGGETALAEGGIDWGTHPARLVIRRPGVADRREELASTGHAEALTKILDALKQGPAAPLKALSEIDAVGHRVVHGGSRFTAAVRITPEVRQAIADLAELAPLHNPAALEGIDAVTKVMPAVPQVAAFDTAFHATLPPAAHTYAVPGKWTRDWNLRRFGFHGLSHAYCAARAKEMIGPFKSRLIIAHLGNGASISAVRDGKSVDTSMGFTPLEGLMMGTRSGSIDPGLVIYLLRHKNLSVDQIDHALNHESGLLGVSGVSADMRQILAAAPQNPAAQLALDMFIHRIRQTIGSMAATLGGVDGLIFTAGIGENAAIVRQRVCADLDFIGIHMDNAANASAAPDADVSLPESPAHILVIATREDLTILRQTRSLLENSTP